MTALDHNIKSHRFSHANMCVYHILTEFGDMLKETLDKMRESIDVNSSTFENETGVPIIRRLEEFNLTSAYQGGDTKAK